MGIEIENKNGILDLEHDAALEIEWKNPLFNELGSYSLPFSFKNNPHNSYVLGFPDNYERKDRYEDRQPVNVRAGILNENATLELLEVVDKIEGVIYLHETSFYQQVQEIKLPQVFEGVKRYFQPETVKLENRKKYILDMLEQMIFSDIDKSQDFTIFPVAIECELNPRIFEGSTGATAKAQDIINRIYTHYEPGQDKPQRRLAGKYPYSYNDDNDIPIKIPVGYGVSPFLRFGYVLRKIFEYFGFTLETNLFDNDLAPIVVVNNTMDAIMEGCFVESQLVPDCTINDFLDIVREGFCADFKVDPARKTAKIIFFNDVLDAPPDIDLTEFLVNHYEKTGITKPKQVRLTVNKNLPMASSATDTLIEFNRKFEKFEPIFPLQIKEDGIFGSYAQNSIWKLSEPESVWQWKTYKADRISSMNFDYDTADDIEREEHKIPFEAVVTLPVAADGDHLSYHTAIIGSGRNLNSHIILNSEKKVDEEVVQCPVILAVEGFFNYRIGTMSNFYSDGILPHVPDPIVSLYLDDLFEKFWKRYNKRCRTSFQPITFRARIPAHILANFTFERLKIVNGQPFVPISLRYKMTDTALIDVEMDFKTTKIYGEDLDPDPVPGEEIPPAFMEFFVGRWATPAGTLNPLGFEAVFEVYSDYSGKIVLKNAYREVNTTFSGVTIVSADDTDLTYKEITLKTPNGDLLIKTMFHMREPEKSFTLTWSDYGGNFNNSFMKPV